MRLSKFQKYLLGIFRRSSDHIYQFIYFPQQQSKISRIRLIQASHSWQMFFFFLFWEIVLFETRLVKYLSSEISITFICIYNLIRISEIDEVWYGDIGLRSRTVSEKMFFLWKAKKTKCCQSCQNPSFSRPRYSLLFHPGSEILNEYCMIFQEAILFGFWNKRQK